jgi:hypothetical protein
VPFDVPGAKRLNVDWAMGPLKTKDMPPLGAHVTTSGESGYEEGARNYS